jgi:hypothetical protein
MKEFAQQSEKYRCRAPWMRRLAAPVVCPKLGPISRQVSGTAVGRGIGEQWQPGRRSAPKTSAEPSRLVGTSPAALPRTPFELSRLRGGRYA